MRKQIEIDNAFNDLLKEVAEINKEWVKRPQKPGETWIDRNDLLRRHEEINVILKTLSWASGVPIKLTK